MIVLDGFYILESFDNMNERLESLSGFKKSTFLIDYCDNSAYFLDLYNRYFKELFENSFDFNCIDQIKIDYLESFVVTLLQKDKLNYFENTFLETIKKVYLYYMQNDNPCIQSSLLFRRDVIESGILNKLFVGGDMQIFLDYHKKMENKALSFYDKYINEDKLTNQELLILFKFLDKNLFTNDKSILKMMDVIFDKLLEQQEKNTSIENEFLAHLISKKCCYSRNVIYNKPYLSSVDLNGDDLVNTLGFSYGRKNIVVVKSDHKGYLHSLAHTVVHELHHYFQNMELDKNSVSEHNYKKSKSAILRSFYTDSEHDEYSVNYWSEETEYDSNLEAYSWLLMRLKGEARDSERKRKNEYIFNFKFASKISKGSTIRETLDDYEIPKLQYAIRNNPSFLDSFEIMKVFFNSDGSLKKINELLTSYVQFNGYQKNAFYQVFSYHMYRSFAFYNSIYDSCKNDVEKFYYYKYMLKFYKENISDLKILLEHFDSSKHDGKILFDLLRKKFLILGRARKFLLTHLEEYELIGKNNIDSFGLDGIVRKDSIIDLLNEDVLNKLMVIASYNANFNQNDMDNINTLASKSGLSM